MKKLASFADLISLIATNSAYQKFFESNQYGICGAIARAEFGQLWDVAYQLLVQQGRLYREADSMLDIAKLLLMDEGMNNGPGHGVLEHGMGIGEAEIVHLLRYKASLEVLRPKFVQGVIAIQNRFGLTITLPIMLTGSTINTDQQNHIDRAFFQYWTLYLAYVPEAQSKILSCKAAKCPWKRNWNGLHMRCWWANFESLGDKDKQAMQAVQFTQVDKDLLFKDSKQTIREIEQVRLALYTTYEHNLLPGILGPADQGANSRYENLYNDKYGVLNEVVKEYLGYRARILEIDNF